MQGFFLSKAKEVKRVSQKMKLVHNACRNCKKVFAAVAETAYCSDCKHIDDAQFAKIEQFLLENPLSNALQISGSTRISTHEILRYIDEGRLIVVQGNIVKAIEAAGSSEQKNV